MRTAGERDRADTGALDRGRREEVTEETEKEVRRAGGGGGTGELSDEEGGDLEGRLNLPRVMIVSG